MKSHFCLTFYEAVIRQATRELIAHVLAHIPQIERLQVAVPPRMEEYQDRHYLAVGHPAGTVAVALPVCRNHTFFQLRLKIFTEVVENTENFY